MSDVAPETRVLLVDADARMRGFVAAYLRTNGIVAIEAETIGGGLAIFAAQRFDVVIAEIEFADGSGFDMIRQMRSRRDCAVIFVTSQRSSGMHIKGLDSGADDYVVKPIEIRELFARMRAVLRRYRRLPPQPPVHDAVPVIELGNWTLDLVRRELSDSAGELVRLTRAELDLLAALVQARGEPLSREYLVEVVASADADTKVRTIDVMVSRIRRKLAAASGPPPRVLTQKGAGYRYAAAAIVAQHAGRAPVVVPGASAPTDAVVASALQGGTIVSGFSHPE